MAGGGGSLGMAGSDSNSQSQFNQRVWKPQAKALRNLFNEAKNLYSGQIGDINMALPGAIQGQKDVYGQAQGGWQDQLKGGAFKDMGLQNRLAGSLDRSLNSPTATQEINNMIMGGKGNNYADAMKQTYMRDAQNAQAQMLSNLDARVGGGGLPGSSRHGVATALGMRDINQNLQGNLARTGFETFDKDLDRKLGIAQQADQGTLARQQMLSGMIGQQNQAQQQGLNFGQNMQGLNMGQFNPYAVPWQAAGSYSNILGNPVVLGSGSSSSDAKSKGLSASGYGGVGGGFGGGGGGGGGGGQG
jgi:hypothetical protein